MNNRARGGWWSRVNRRVLFEELHFVFFCYEVEEKQEDLIVWTGGLGLPPFAQGPSQLPESAFESRGRFDCVERNIRQRRKEGGQTTRNIPPRLPILSFSPLIKTFYHGQWSLTLQLRSCYSFSFISLREFFVVAGGWKRGVSYMDEPDGTT